MSVWITVALFSIAVFGAFAWVLRKLMKPDVLPAREWLENFSVDRYRPMHRLLSTDDYDFLATDCGYDKRTIRKVEAERRAIFRAYLRNLTRDFNRLHSAARLLLLDSPVDRPDLAETLLKMRLNFTLSLVAIHYRLVLHAAGLGQVDVRGLLGSVDGLRAQCATLASAPMSA